jgi:hypothetical protein
LPTEKIDAVRCFISGWNMELRRAARALNVS